MSVWSRSILGILAGFVYSCLIGFKALDLAKTEKSSDDQTGTSEKQINDNRQALQFDIFRLASDCILLIAFLASDLCPAWFSLFPDNPPGICAGCICLITFTLAVSIFVDWISIRKNWRAKDREPVPFPRFLKRQLTSFLRIEIALVLIWGVFAILEPPKVSVMIRIIAAAGVLLLFRGLLQLAEKLKHKAD